MSMSNNTKNTPYKKRGRISILLSLEFFCIGIVIRPEAIYITPFPCVAIRIWMGQTYKYIRNARVASKRAFQRKEQALTCLKNSRKPFHCLGNGELRLIYNLCDQDSEKKKAFLQEKINNNANKVQRRGLQLKINHAHDLMFNAAEEMLERNMTFAENYKKQGERE